MSTTQLNVRLDNELKTQVDEALATMGRSATDAVRTLWLYIAQQQRANKLATADNLLQRLAAEARDVASVEHRRKLPAEGERIYVDGLRELGLDAGNLKPLSISDEELLEEALLERMGERGLLG